MTNVTRHHPTWDTHGNRNAPWGKPGTRTHGPVVCLVQLSGNRSGRIKEYLVRFRNREAALQRLAESLGRPRPWPRYVFRFFEMRKA